mmetsp:Transcript_56323/g.129325  ORF Transcript_56323/g.129325 Transcript_56323/m.129325 type:complete len:127 (-) Transcript_56323:412-792(-)
MAYVQNAGVTAVVQNGRAKRSYLQNLLRRKWNWSRAKRACCEICIKSCDSFGGSTSGAKSSSNSKNSSLQRSPNSLKETCRVEAPPCTLRQRQSSSRIKSRSERVSAGLSQLGADMSRFSAPHSSL